MILFGGGGSGPRLVGRTEVHRCGLPPGLGGLAWSTTSPAGAPTPVDEGEGSLRGPDRRLCRTAAPAAHAVPTVPVVLWLPRAWPDCIGRGLLGLAWLTSGGGGRGLGRSVSGVEVRIAGPGFPVGGLSGCGLLALVVLRTWWSGKVDFCCLRELGCPGILVAWAAAGEALHAGCEL
ncbi:hypothetical protein NDU88_008938 [Pleurodeles waltl]|uniref:Uncharacterized protein n=1 Tax=Pleurodeles waltl TaxID=8319 RepID=A0AAV7P0R0_PLEWA|nr:hypothetical protein NDU88_008938 [Pleurodeles waltl]